MPSSGAAPEAKTQRRCCQILEEVTSAPRRSAKVSLREGRPKQETVRGPRPPKKKEKKTLYPFAQEGHRHVPPTQWCNPRKTRPETQKPSHPGEAAGVPRMEAKGRPVAQGRGLSRRTTPPQHPRRRCQQLAWVWGTEVLLQTKCSRAPKSPVGQEVIRS